MLNNSPPIFSIYRHIHLHSLHHSCDFFFSQRVPFQVLIYLYISSRFMRDNDAQFYRILISYTRHGKASQDITGDVKMGRFEFLNQSGQTNSEEILIWKKRSRIENDRKLIKVTRSDENRAHFHMKYFDDFPMLKWEWFDWENVSFLFCFKSKMVFELMIAHISSRSLSPSLLRFGNL